MSLNQVSSDGLEAALSSVGMKETLENPASLLFDIRVPRFDFIQASYLW